jgi:membrane protease subunit HflK
VPSGQQNFMAVYNRSQGDYYAWYPPLENAMKQTKSIRQKIRGEVEPKMVAIGIVVVLLIMIAQDGYYTVPQDSESVVTRFGKYQGPPSKPGLHFKVPFIDRYQTVETLRQKKQEYGFSTAGHQTNPTQSSASREEQQRERTMVTGDKNLADLQWIIQYKIKDPKLFLFNVKDPELTLRDVSESVMREIVGDSTVDEVLTSGRQNIENDALSQMQAVVDKYEMGLNINQVQLKDVNPPPDVQRSFDSVNEAQQERERLINVAMGEYSIVGKLEGEAEQKVRAAEGYASKRVNEAEGDVARFNAMLIQYLKAPEVTKRRIYLETMEEVLPQVKNKIILDDSANQVLPLLPLGNSLKGTP